MRKIEFYINYDGQDILVRKEFYWRTIRAIRHHDHWVSIGNHFHCKVYDLISPHDSANKIWRRIESKVEPIGSTGNAKG